MELKDGATPITSRSQARLRIQLQVEMVRGDIHAAIEVEAVGGKTLHAGIEGKVFAALFLRVFEQPIEKRGTESARAVGIVRDEVVDVEGAAGKKEIEDAKPSDGTDGAIQLEIGQPVSLFLLLENARGKIDRFDMRSQFAHDRRTASDMLRCRGERNSP
jgi:hypothetical protein